MPLSLVTAPTVEPITVREAARQVILGDSMAGEPAPFAPTVALPVVAVAGNCDNGAWRVGLTCVTADGETQLGDLSDIVTIADKTVNGKIFASNLATGGVSVLSRKVYLVAPGETIARYASTINDNVTTSTTLSIAASSLGADAPSTNTTSDPELVAWISAARGRAESATWRAMNTQTWDLLLDRFPAEGFIEIPKPPLQSVTWVKYTDTQGNEQTLSPSLYLTQAPSGDYCRRGRVALPFASVWPVTIRQMGAVKVRFVCGYGDTAASVPALLRAAMKMDLGALYANRESLVIGTIVSKLPGGTFDIYKSFKSNPTQRLRGIEDSREMSLW